MADLVLSVQAVSKTFPGRPPVEALREVSLRVESEAFVSIVGPSGCGKSTLFNLIAGIEKPDSGSIIVARETDADARRRLAGYMFQKDLLFPWRSVLDNAALGLEVERSCDRAEARRRARALLPRFGLGGFETMRPHQLSGGMRQRVALARTLLLNRPLLLLDEPFASLDALTRRDLQAWLKTTWQSGSRAALLVTHDVREALALSDRVYVMSPRPGHMIEEIEVRSAGQEPDAFQLSRLESEVLSVLGIETATA